MVLSLRRGECEPVQFGLDYREQRFAGLLSAEINTNVEVPAAYCEPEKSLLDTGQRLTLPAVVDAEVPKTWRPNSTLEHERMPRPADGHSPNKRSVRVAFLQVIEDPERGERTAVRSRRERKYLRRLCRIRRARRDRKPPGVLRIPGGGSVLARRSAATGDAESTSTVRNARDTARATIILRLRLPSGVRSRRGTFKNSMSILVRGVRERRSLTPPR
jgi:hypothetical protein